MKNKEHLIYNTVFIIILFLIINFIFKINFEELNYIHLIIAIFIFSNLPDIDHSKSKITKLFFLIYFILLIYGIIDIFDKEIIGIIKIIISIFLIIYHLIIGENSSKHRKFPHTFTFGIISSIILYIFTSITISFVGFICFSLHIIEDKYFNKAINNDIKFWKKLFKRIRKLLI